MLMAAKPRYWQVPCLVSVLSLQFAEPTLPILLLSILSLASSILIPFSIPPSGPCSENLTGSYSLSPPGPVPQGALHSE